MEKDMEKVCAEGFRFFGKTNRLISHELKNILAIISETIGLLDELVELSESGMQLTSEKLRSMSASIIEEVERANTVIRCMNTFAHSVDEFVREIDLGEIVSLTIQLVQLNPVSKVVKIEFAENGSHKIYTSPFFLENLLYHVFYVALSAASAQKHIKISLFADGHKSGVEISGMGPDGIKSFSTEPIGLLAKTIGAEITSDIPAGPFRVLFPQKLTGGPLQAGSMTHLDSSNT